MLLSGKKTVHFDGQEYEVAANIDQIKGFSAHGDANDLVKFISCEDPGQVRGVFVVHGERNARERLSARLRARGFYPISTPEMHESVTLNLHKNAPTQ